MKRLSPARLLAVSSLILVGLGGPTVWRRAVAETQLRVELPPTFGDDFASRVVGHHQCVDCHRSEYRRWARSKHAGRAFDLLRTSQNAREYAEKMEIAPSAIATSAVCTECHATRQRTHSGRQRVLAGVSCESCHNPAGREDGWLNAHAVYGATGVRREQESAEHYRQRGDRCRQAGQLRSAELYELARRCYECHVVGNERLVNVAEHPSASRAFEFADKSLGEVRHNFHLNQAVNAQVSTLWMGPVHGGGQQRTVAGRKRLMFVVGAMVDLEMSLRNLAKATDEDGDYFEDMAERVVDSFEFLDEDILGELEEEVPPIEQAVEAAKEVYEKVDDEEFALDDDKPACLAAADAVGKAARELVRTEDGQKLTALDEPEVPEDGGNDGSR